MRIIVVGNEKGGCGKTTLAVNIASMAVRAGQDVLLVDADPGQQSSVKWAARRREAHPEAPPVRCISLTGRNIAAEVTDLAQRYDLLVVDTGAEDSPELRAAATVAAVLVIPVQPEALDLWTLPTMELLYEKAATFNAGLRVVLALNRIPHQLADTAPTEISQWLAANVPNLPIAAMVPLIGRAAHGRATGDGLGVGEVPRRVLKATLEMDKLYEQVMT